jgi:Ca2+-binding EF-hand superfamily protein
LTPLPPCHCHSRYDADASATIDAKELRPLMKEFGVELSKKATTKLLQVCF